MYKQFYKIITLVSFSVLAISQVFALAPLPAKFYASTFSAKVGDTIEFELKVNPSADKPVYTVISNLEYDKDLLTFKSTSFEPGWVAVSPEDITDTKNGLIKRTAGFPTGLKGLGSLIKYTFVAKSKGDATVNIIGSSAYDAENTDYGVQNKSITVKITDGPTGEVIPEKKATEKPVEKVAKRVTQEIAISLVGNTALISNTENTFKISHAFGEKQLTSGTTTVEILNDVGVTVVKEDLTYLADSDTDLMYAVPANSLSEGNYILRATTKYQDQKNTKSPLSVSKEFGVVTPAKQIVQNNVPVPYVPIYIWIIFAILIIIIGVMIIYNNSKKFRKFVKNF